MEELQRLVDLCRPLYTRGQAASYIPALADKDPSLFFVHIIDEHGKSFSSGDVTEKFTLQSISKVISFIYVCEEHGLDEVLKHVDVEPTGDSFNSIIRLENTYLGKPFNPLINAGAITVSSLLVGNTKEQQLVGLYNFISKMTGVETTINEEVYQSEIVTADRNRAIAYYLKSNEVLVGDVEVALDNYFRQCSIEVDARCLAKIGLILSNDGVDPLTNEYFFSKKIAKVAKALMLTCGMYNASGKFATFVGIPAKSGVSGAVLSIANPESMEGLSGKIGIATFGPAIDEIGNSVTSIAFLKKISEQYDLSIF
ncbi:glutaminase A [Kurthia sibirica]|uniref:Glutaminase n=1 Tax=Kurthia sibirica TaxID=202750 RepID=A0A2U3AI48_9BACL|nr:glutaminase A [Kurthia sibirica]PWI24200.1 glutaminase A [Kurthia sibirica]GEK34820.1 glutaminase 2 [Kurthia sibirica]